MPHFSTLNEAQQQAVLTHDVPLLVIAGAGSGKTRTVVHRLAHLHEKGVSPYSMLLLTFTRKAAQEMLHRASSLMAADLLGIQGGTFHAFAYNLLRQFPPEWAKNTLSILDSSDSASILSNLKDSKKIGKRDRSFPKNQTLLSLMSRARNKEISLEETVRRESQHLLPYLDELLELESSYSAYRKEHFVLDYDDLLFELETALRENERLRDYMHDRFRYIMVDEYQDTNKVQARLVRLCTGPESNVMAVGDDAQSIYAFRGADVQNILEFPKLFANTKVIRLEENYRSVQPILDVSNAILKNAPFGFQKNLFSKREYDLRPWVKMYRPMSDISQARLAAQKIAELLRTEDPQEIAVLFRAGYQSYHLEVELNKLNIMFKKYGGVRYTEASHIKDILAFARLLINPVDLPAFERVASLSKGVGPKTAHKIFSIAIQGDKAALQKACAKYEKLWQDLLLLMEIQQAKATPEQVFRRLIEHYQPRMEEIYPDDWPRRQQGLEELIGIAKAYQDLALFMADLSLENPDDDKDKEEEMRRSITLSTVHSAKGLEWQHVFILDLVEDRFPSRHALTRADDYEEERRLLYVACTRAKDSLNLFVPQKIFQRNQGFEERATPSPFICEIPSSMYMEVMERFGGQLVENVQTSSLPTTSYLQKHTKEPSAYNQEDFSQELPDEKEEKEEKVNPYTYKNKRDDHKDSYVNFDNRERSKALDDIDFASRQPQIKTAHLGFCTHKVFGRGKVIQEIDKDKVRVNFVGFGLKVIMKNYVTFD